MNYPELPIILDMLSRAKTIVVLQADNPDADSLSCSLALENILGDQGKEIYLYCSVDIPQYLHYLKGWDRVSKEMPRQFDASIIVDASTRTLFDKLQQSGERGWIAGKPCVILDHHATVEKKIDFATVSLLDATVSSTAELVYTVARQLDWQITPETGSFLMTGILADTQGLSNDLASAGTYRIMAELLDLGVNRPQLEEQRREYNRMPLQIFRYKAKLIERTEFAADNRIAHVVVPQIEINTHSPLYNPVPLIQNDMLITTGVQLAIVFKQYDDGRITGAIRANVGYPVADKLAEHMNGGGHPYASGFKVVHGRTFAETRADCLRFAAELLDSVAKKDAHETL